MMSARPILLSWLLILFAFIKSVLCAPMQDEVAAETHLINLEVRSSINLNGRRIMSVNDHLDTYGPTIRVKSGDTINLSLKNLICSAEEINESDSNHILKEYCETALHFHGLTPIGNENDGVPGFTQPPILSGEVYWYNFTVPTGTCGTFWYHSHSAVQYGDGFRGILIVECPRYTSTIKKVFGALKQMSDIQSGRLSLPDEEYDTTGQYEEQVIALSDWYYRWNLDVAKDSVLSYDSTTDPHIDQSLINGLEDDNIKFNLRGDTEAVVIRIINTGMSGTQIFHVEDHKLVILEADGVLVNPYVIDSLSLAVGQRYTIMVKLNDNDLQKGVRVVNGCNKMMGYIEKTAWFVTETTPQITSNTQVRIKDLPGLDKNEMFKELEPRYQLDPERKGLWGESDIQSIVLDYEYFSDTDIIQKYGTGMYKMNGKTLAEYVKEPIEFETGQVIQIIINAVDHMRHPWHLHGHPFQVVSIGTGKEGALEMDDLNNDAGRKYKKDISFWEETGQIPMTRDSINIPGRSYAAIRIIANSPGLWLMHCHIDWHVQKGLGVAFHEIESRSLDESEPPQEPRPAVIVGPSPDTDTETGMEADSHRSQQPANRLMVLIIYFLIMVAINTCIYKLIM